MNGSADMDPAEAYKLITDAIPPWEDADEVRDALLALIDAALARPLTPEELAQ